MSDNSLNTFPANKYEALAMLYVQSQDLSDLTPDELLDKYLDAYEKIREHSKKRPRKSSKTWTV